ncbi:MAG: hypothetical protein ABIQ01_05675 [Pseudolysinimonas sp.]
MAGAKTLATTVHVTDEAGKTHVLEPGKSVPADLAKLITNPKAWSGDAPAPEESESSGSGSGDSGTLSKPPVAGAGSSGDDWKAYAVQEGISVPDGAKKADIVALVTEHEGQAS